MHLSVEGFFVPGFPKLLRFQEHHDKILKKLLSRLFKNLVSSNLKAAPVAILKILTNLIILNSLTLITYPNQQRSKKFFFSVC